MAIKNKQKNNNTDDSNYIISPDKKKKIVGLFLLILSVLFFFSILSYARKDSPNINDWWADFTNSFSPDAEFVAKQQGTSNWLGVFGAYTSNFLINNTIGVFSVFLPVVLFLFGYSIIIKQKNKVIITLSNFLLTMGILLSSFMGLVRFKFGIFTDAKELSGKIGDFLGQSVGFLLGGLGGIIFFFFAIFLTVFLTFDLNYSKIINWFKYLWSDVLIEKNDDNEDEKDEVIKDSGKNKDEDRGDKKKNLEKIKDLKEAAKPKAKLSMLKDVLGEDEEEDTRIEIVRKENDKKPETKIDTIVKPIEKPKKDKETDAVKKDTSLVSNNDEDIKLSDDLPLVDLAKEIKKEAKLPDQWEEEINFDPIPLEKFTTYPNDGANISDEELKRNAELLTEKLALFDIKIEDIKVHPGPVVTMYEIVPSPGVKISRIVSLENDIALALAARGIRIIAPIPGKSAIGVEIPNATASMVSARSVLEKLREFKGNLPLAFGKEINGDIHIADLSTIPHLLVAGSTGSGKSVGINMMIMSLIYTKHPGDIKFVIIDPKKIELSFYQRLNKHYLAVSPDLDEEIITTPSNALIVLKAAVLEMEKRYDMLSKAGARNILEYN
nr:DNA translocase FtsK 4TM domain-containing protein [Melioribacteraceae bacterium]